jgi:riboflavin kinase/FMN adenylyltransferase
MKVFRNAFRAGRELPGAVLALGKFDALHRGHRRVLRAARAKARALKTSCVVVTFDPAPEPFRGISPRRPILSMAERLRRLAGLGLDAVVLLPFGKKLACLSPEAFAKTVLAAQLKPRCVCVGEDFCYGKDRSGRVETLEDIGPALGFSVCSVPLLTSAGEKITAERIRRLLDDGRVPEAESLLGWRLDPTP